MKYLYYNKYRKSATTSKQHANTICRNREKWAVYNYAHNEEVNTAEYGTWAFHSSPYVCPLKILNKNTCTLHMRSLILLQFLYTCSESVYEWTCRFSTSFSPSLSWKASSLLSLNWRTILISGTTACIPWYMDCVCVSVCTPIARLRAIAIATNLQTFAHWQTSKSWSGLLKIYVKYRLFEFHTDLPQTVSPSDFIMTAIALWTQAGTRCNLDGAVSIQNHYQLKTWWCMIDDDTWFVHELLSTSSYNYCAYESLLASVHTHGYAYKLYRGKLGNYSKASQFVPLKPSSHTHW